MILSIASKSWQESLMVNLENFSVPVLLAIFAAAAAAVWIAGRESRNWVNENSFGLPRILLRQGYGVTGDTDLTDLGAELLKCWGEKSWERKR
jgi:hypothetical protein